MERGCAETRSSGAEGGPGKRAVRDPGTAPRSDPYIIGKGNKSQIATLVERTTRTVMLVRIPDDRNAERVAELLSRKMETLPEFLRNSVTWDQGKELARHVDFTVRTGMPRLLLRSPRSGGSTTVRSTVRDGQANPVGVGPLNGLIEVRMVLRPFDIEDAPALVNLVVALPIDRPLDQGEWHTLLGSISTVIAVLLWTSGRRLSPLM